MSDTTAAPLICPSCREEVDRKKDGSMPKFCGDCGADLKSLTEQTSCPNCSAQRTKNRKGEYRRFCVDCRHDFDASTEIKTLAAVVSSVKGSNSTINSSEQPKEDDPEYTQNITNPIPLIKDKEINNQPQIQYDHHTAEADLAQSALSQAKLPKDAKHTQHTRPPDDPERSAVTSQWVLKSDTTQPDNVTIKMDSEEVLLAKKEGENSSRSSMPNQPKMEVKSYAQAASRASKPPLSQTAESTRRKTDAKSWDTQFTEMNQRFQQLSTDMEKDLAKPLFDQADKDYVKEALKKASDIQRSHENLMRSISSAKTLEEEQQRSLKLSSSQNAFCKFITTRSEHLHSLLARLQSIKVKDDKISLPQGAQRTYGRTINFKAVLSDSAEERFKDYANFSVEVHGKTDFNQDWSTRAILTRNSDGIYQGVCDSLRLREKKLYYKYVICATDKNNHQHIHWEHLHKSDTNRFLEFSDDSKNVVVHDGAIIIKKFLKKGIVSTLIDYFSTRGVSFSAEQQERLRGFKLMLPQWIIETKKGTTLETLAKWVDDAVIRQSLAYDDFKHKGHGNTPREVEEVLREHFEEQIGCHMSLFKELSKTKACISLLGLMVVGGRYFTNSAEDLMYRSLIGCAKSTLGWIADGLDKDNIANLHDAFTAISEELKLPFQTAIHKIMQRSSAENDGNGWVVLIPLYHMLKGASKSTQVGDFKSKVWWGTDGFDAEVQSLKSLTRNRPDAWKEYWGCFQSLFKLCSLLSTTLLDLLTDFQLIDLLKSDVDMRDLEVTAVLACTKYHMMNAEKQHTRKLFLLQAVLCYLQKTRPRVLDTAQCSTVMAQLLESFPTPLSSCVDPAYLWSNVSTAVLVTLSAIDICVLQKERKSIPAELGVNLISFADRYQQHLYRFKTYNEFVERESGEWAELFIFEGIKSDMVRNWWTEKSQAAFKARLLKAGSPDQVLEVYYDTENRIREMDEVVAEFVSSQMPRWIESGKTDMIQKTHMSSDQHCLVVQKIIQDTWAPIPEANVMDIVRKMLECGGFISIYDTYKRLTDKLGKNCLSEQCTSVMSNSVLAFEHVIQLIMNADISLQNFKEIQPHQPTILRICEISTYQSCIDDVDRAMARRGKELASYLSFLNEFGGLWQSCQYYFPADPSIDDWLRTPLHAVSFNDRVNALTLEIECDVIPTHVRAVITAFSKYKSDKIFLDMFLREVTGKDNWDAVVNCYHYIVTKYEGLLSSLTDGSMDVTTLYDIKRRYYNDSKDELLEELHELIPDEKICKQRSKEINILVELDQYYDGAKIMLDMKDMFELPGDFSALEKVVQAKKHTIKIGSISPQLIDSAKKLRHITTEQHECLRAFADCPKFIAWVRCDVKKHEVNIFVNLARSAMEEDDLAADKARYLHAALTGYSPLIYEFREKNISYPAFMDLCDRVWKGLERNPNLSQNLRDSSKQLEFWNNVKKHYQNVEMHSITQATAINSTGIYRVGNIKGVSKDFKTLDNVVRLSCEFTEKQETGEVTRTREYSYSEIRKLQSKLTLVAGEKQRDNMDIIQNFDEMRDAIENLGNAYIDIRREGCIQFDDLLVVIHCNQDHKTAVEIQLKSVEKKMFGTTREKTVLEHTNDIHAYLAACLQKWRASMNDKRSENQGLNHFTTEQLVVLRKELGRYLSSGDKNCLQQSIPLLAMVHSVNSDQILPILKEYENDEEKRKMQQDKGNFVLYEDMPTKLSETVDYVEEELGVHQHVAVLAVNQLGVDDAIDLDKLRDWNANRIATQKESSTSSKTSDDILRKIMMDSTSYLKLEDQLKRLWEEFITLTSGSIKNFLGIPHLSYLLQKLQCEALTMAAPRKLPDWLYRGKALLISTPAYDTYKMVLTIYEVDSEYPKPTRNEVLVCTTMTREEEVTLFMNRALNDSKSFYCMVNCHLLGFEACRVIETRLSSLADNREKDFGLAFIYAEEAKDSRIRAYLDKQLVRNAQPADVTTLSAYVAKITGISTTGPSAAMVDPQRSKVRLIRSERAGVGKSLQKHNLCNRLRETNRLPGMDVTIPAYRRLKTDAIISRLTHLLGNGHREGFDTIHLDIAHEVDAGVDELLFNLIVLGSIVNSEGVVWQARDTQYYIIESMPCLRKHEASGQETSAHEILDLLPTMMCVTPEQAQRKYRENKGPHSFLGFDNNILAAPEWQNVLRYLEAFQNKSAKIERTKKFSSPYDALRLITSHCGIKDPTWLELRHYVHFLSNQLTKVANSPYCASFNDDVFPGFRDFVIKFMISMAKDFGTRSLKIAEESPGKNLVLDNQNSTVLSDLSMKKTWEGTNYPYLFFNEDGQTFTPLGFNIKSDGKLYDLSGYKLTRRLVEALKQNKMTLSENFDQLSRNAKLKKLRDVMVKKVLYGEPQVVKGKKMFVEKPMFVDGDDPDQNYVLTMDNAKKIIAIHQRLRVNIPVIIMGETGCGKTKLIDFMSKLQVPSELKQELKTMITVKIHGGTAEQDIIQRVVEAEALAKRNSDICKRYAEKHDSKMVHNVYTVLFLDEANTTEAIGLVKEILCDGRMNGMPLKTDTGLKIIAACNPYRRHSTAMIEKLKKAGLGYNVEDTYTKDKLDDPPGKDNLRAVLMMQPAARHIPMRHLVYRVQALPQSLLPLVWDFGTLTKEREYIEQMICKVDDNAGDGDLKFGRLREHVSVMLCKSQAFMRSQRDECSFVSLRDVTRLLEVANWFFRNQQAIFSGMDGVLSQTQQAVEIKGLDVTVRSLLMGIGVCYMARLENPSRISYSTNIGQEIAALIGGGLDGAEQLRDQVELCQDFFVEEVIDPKVHINIAKNKALKENVFMMIVCIENRIPLFVVGKPGSSKSLSKALVLEAMKGETAGIGIFKRLKETYMESFQCSRHATAADIVDVFRTCSSYQKNQQDLSKFVSVVVLDEVGLAEDSENMPLKALHPLLEEGCEGVNEWQAYMKCAFIGISNWALDPAKMNRGIFVQRGTPANKELEQIAKEICRSDGGAGNAVITLIKPLADGYLKTCGAKKPVERDMTEFFGLRDFYSLMKMVVNFAKSVKGKLNKNQLEHSIRRNFGGFDPKDFDPMRVFEQECPQLGDLPQNKNRTPSTDPIELIKSALSGTETALKGMESRYLLILTENLSVLNIVLNQFDTNAEVVFGSRFKDDVSYTQVCHNIFRIKMCMDRGTPVILLNLDDLYESLYDALNQYFTYLGNKKYVDLGLGTHRVKAFVADSFRLVVIADKKKVLSQFPIPLINRLEKHYISASTMLTGDQRKVQMDLELWMEDFVTSEKDSIESCALLCEGCNKENLYQPYRMPCQRHHIGKCCRDRMFREEIPNRCPIDGCECDIDIDTEDEWVIDKQALENRQYFENSTVENCFVGYSTETTALVVMIVFDKLFSDPDKPKGLAEFWSQVTEQAKHYLVQCASAESVLRLDKTILKSEASAIQKVYISEQNHETLLEFLEAELFVTADKSLLMQVSSFAEVMTSNDIELLGNHLNASENSYTVLTHYLKDFLKESQFTKTISTFYNRIRDDKTGLLIIQCEAANDSIELLDAVRYIIQRETMSAKKVNHTVLLLSLCRGLPFNGFQGGEWKCVHIDDPRPPQFQLPPLRRCLEIKPSELIAGQLHIFGDTDSNHHVEEAATHEDMTVDEFYDMPALEDDDPDTESREEHLTEIPDYELAGKEFIQPVNIMPFIEYCLPAAMSKIKSKRSQNGSSVLKACFNTDKDFLTTFLRHVKSLLKEEEGYSQSQQWVKTDAAKASHMKKSETLRHAVEDSLERAFVPALAAVTSFIGPQNNLQLLSDVSTRIRELWNGIFHLCGSEGLNFEAITKGSSSKLPESFHIESYGADNYSNRYPFSWIVKHLIDRFVKLPEKTATINLDLEGKWLTNPLKQSPLGKFILADNIESEESVVNAYASDFIHMTYTEQSNTEYELIQKILMDSLQRTFGIKAGLAHVHLAHEKLKHQILNMTEVFRLKITRRKEDLDVVVLRRIDEDEARYKGLIARRNLHIPVQDTQMKDTEQNDEVAKAEHSNSGVDLEDVQLDGDTIQDMALIMPSDILALEALIDDMIQISLSEMQTKPEQWVNDVDQAKSVMERILSHGSGFPEQRDNVRRKWQKLELQKLYVEHVIIPSPVHEGKRKHGKVLSFMKGVKGTEFQKEEFFQQVVAALRTVIKDAIRALYPNCPPNCPTCHDPLDTPAKLPCGHMLCAMCAKQNETCPADDCDKAIPGNYEYKPEDDDSLDKERLTIFKGQRGRLNSFFMHFVSELVFTQAVIPEGGILEWLMDCVTFRDTTRDFSLFYSKDVIDPTPVLRSFLLKLFLQCEDDSVEAHLNRIMSSWHEDDGDLQIQKMALVVGCYQDLNNHRLQLPSEELPIALTRLNAERDTIGRPTVAAFTSIADIQCILRQCIDQIGKNHTVTKDVLESLREFLGRAENSGNEQICYYIMRQMLKTDGESRIKDLINTPMKFLVPTKIQQSLSSFTVPDMFSIFGGERYEEAKAAVERIILDSGSEARLRNALIELFKLHQKDARALLPAFFTRISRTFTDAVPVSLTTRTKIIDALCASAADQHAKTVGKLLLATGTICQELRVDQSKGLNMLMLVLNTLTSFKHDQNTGLLNPLTEIITKPDVAKDHLFPTMEDNLMELVFANQKTRDQTIPWKCPNGHLYYLGNCGKPAFTFKCPDCKATIGGRGYIPHAGNTKLDGDSNELKTQSGHILGHPGSRGEPGPHRELKILPCVVLRCLTHLFMFTSSILHKNKVYEMIKPRLRIPEDVTSFIEGHIQIDLQHIAACCGESTEDCILLIHELLQRISKAGTSTSKAVVLDKMQTRTAWEPKFAKQFILPVFRDQKAAILKKIKTELRRKRPENLEVLLSTADSPLNRANLFASPGLWEYRRPLTLTSLMNLLEGDESKTYPYLLSMLKNCASLIAVKYLPDILHLMRHLSEKYHSKYSRMKAKEIRANEICKSELHIKKLIASYVSAWNIAIRSQNFNSSGQVIDLVDDPRLSDLLPDKHATMFGATESNPRRLISFLIETHNNIIFDDGTTIGLREVSGFAVVTLTSEEQLLGLVASHIEYELDAESRQRTPKYNLQAAEREISQRFIGQRLKIKAPSEDLPAYMFEEDFNVLNQIAALSETQERMSVEQRSALSDSVGRNIQTLTLYIKDLMTIISYLTVMPHVAMDQPLSNFMKDTLDLKRMPNYLNDDIKLMHVQSVWLLLRFTQTDSLMRNDQEPFNDVDPEYNDTMTELIERELKKICVYKSPHTKLLLEELYEYIILKLHKSVTANHLEADDNEMPLKQGLDGFIAIDLERYQRIEKDMPALPSQLLVKHAPQAWQCIWRRFTNQSSSIETTV